MDQQTFLATYNLIESDLQEANISWEELSLIAEEYGKLEHVLREIGKSFIDEYLYDIETAGIHSYRYRTKQVEHLLEKIVRKRKIKHKALIRLLLPTGMFRRCSHVFISENGCKAKYRKPTTICCGFCTKETTNIWW